MGVQCAEANLGRVKGSLCHLNGFLRLKGGGRVLFIFPFTWWLIPFCRCANCCVLLLPSCKSGEASGVLFICVACGSDDNLRIACYPTGSAPSPSPLFGIRPPFWVADDFEAPRCCRLDLSSSLREDELTVDGDSDRTLPLSRYSCFGD